MIRDLAPGGFEWQHPRSWENFQYMSRRHEAISSSEPGTHLWIRCAGISCGKNMLDSSESGCEDETLPEEEPMTLCIAAECEYKGRPAIAMCSDWRGQTGDLNQPELMTGADDTQKTREFRKATVMLAGVHAKAVELATACKIAIREFTETETSYEDLDLTVDRFLRNLEAVALAKKIALIQSLVESTVGIPHSEFVKLPTDQHPDVWHAIKRLDLGADLLIVSVLHEAIIVSLDRWGTARWEHNYRPIGNGAEIARAMLCLQLWTPASLHDSSTYLLTKVPLEECIFRLYEAHFAAHKANPSSVGSAVSFQVLGAHYRASIQPMFLTGLEGLIGAKHRVPPIKRATSKNEILHNFQSFSTGSLEAVEPDEL
jgi:hypothetical protein